jgi:uncharacterized protein YegL
MSTQLNEFTAQTARPLPVIILADTSGSMAEEGKIDALNQSLREMLATFSTTDDLRAEIYVSIITFGGDARLHTNLMPASQVELNDLVASGGTPLGQAFDFSAALIEDKNVIPSRAYRPTVVLVSDGQPTDTWEPALAKLTQQGRAQKADRMALAIGADADVGVLQRFLANPEKKVFRADDARRVKDFFQFVTMSVTTRTRSANPNEVPKMQNPFNLDEL